MILSHLDTPLPAADREDAAWSVLGLVLVVLAWIRLRPAWHAWVLVALGLAFVMFEARYWLRVRRPSPGDNRTGLAVLAELAETIPERLHERVEVRLAAVGGSMTGQLGSLTLAEEIRRRPSRPTLVINLDAPGLGPEVQLAGRGVGLELARLAARDLWIPHRVARWPLRPLDHRPFLLCKIPSVSLAGDRSGEQVRPEGLAAVAQLTTEVALRWARLQATATPAAPASQDESRDRSSQNPG